MIFSIWRAGVVELWLLGYRDTIINVSILACTALFFNAEQMEMYQTGVWLLLHDAEAPYDDL